jgi:hypothetical protein
MWDLKPFRINTLCSQEKSYVFSMYDLKLFSIYRVPKKKIIFLMWDLKLFHIYTLYSQEKNYVFSMWDKKLFDLNTST